jgi:hypothetical protein
MLMVFKRKLKLVNFIFNILYYRLGDRKMIIIWAIVFLFTLIYKGLCRYIVTGNNRVTSTIIKMSLMIIVQSIRVILSSDLVLSSNNSK